MTTVIKGEKDAPCVGELIVVKCFVRGSVLRWRIGNASFFIPGTKTVNFHARVNREGKQSVIPTANGDLIFYQNATYIASNAADSSVNSEFHFYLNGENDFIEIFYSEPNLNPTGENITITVLGMLNLRLKNIALFLMYIYFKSYKGFI